MPSRRPPASSAMSVVVPEAEAKTRRGRRQGNRHREPVGRFRPDAVEQDVCAALRVCGVRVVPPGCGRVVHGHAGAKSGRLIVSVGPSLVQSV